MLTQMCLTADEHHLVETYRKCRKKGMPLFLDNDETETNAFRNEWDGWWRLACRTVTNECPTHGPYKWKSYCQGCATETERRRFESLPAEPLREPFFVDGNFYTTLDEFIDDWANDGYPDLDGAQAVHSQPVSFRWGGLEEYFADSLNPDSEPWDCVEIDRTIEKWIEENKPDLYIGSRIRVSDFAARVMKEVDACNQCGTLLTLEELRKQDPTKPAVCRKCDGGRHD